MKKKWFELEILLIMLLSISIITGDFIKGDKAYNISLNYGPSQPIVGWINISLENEPADSLLTGFDSSIFLKDFLDKNSAAYDCFPSDCESRYSSVGSGADSKSFYLNSLDSKILGIRVTGTVTGVNTLSFNFKTNAGKSCLHPIEIDVLDDGIKEWKSEAVSNDFSCTLSNNYGCWNEDDYVEGNKFLLTTSEYCEKIKILPPLKTFQIGADILEVNGKGGYAEFRIGLSTSKDYECIANTSSGGKISCSIILDEALKNALDAEICISTKDSSGNGKYEIKYENVNPCGSAGEQKYDFPIFAKPGRYASVNDFTFNQELIKDSDINLGSEIMDYITEKYSGKCEPECIIPVKIFGGISQTDTLLNLKLEYSKGGSLEETKIYEIEETSALINSDFIKLELENGNFLTPADYGEEEFSLELDGEEIFNKAIEINPIPEIRDITPHILPALTEVTLTVLLNGSGSNLTYEWDFGDDSEIKTTKTNTIKHTYSDMGNYEISVKISNKFGEANKKVQLSVISPEKIINDTIKKYETNLISLKSQTNNFPDWIKEQVQEKIGIDSIDSQIKLQKEKYNDCKDSCSSDVYVEIMSELLELKIPYQINISKRIESMKFYPDEEEIDFEALKTLGAGEITDSEEDYASAINNWIKENLDIYFESKTYSLYFDNYEKEPLFSYVKISLMPKKDLEKFYAVINQNPSTLKFNNFENKEIGDASSGVIFSELTENQIIEYLSDEEINIQEIPIYFSPELNTLGLAPSGIMCNDNKKCEKELGENYKNCRTDCKPIAWTILFFFALLFGAFIVYIILQEWYKRYYQSYLFKSKNQLFNLINFMSNSSNQGFKRSEIFNKLKNVGWNNEQLNYAWNKLNGKRTGMWEIPIFRFIEKRQIQRELSKRTNNPSLTGLSLN